MLNNDDLLVREVLLRVRQEHAVNRLPVQESAPRDKAKVVLVSGVLVKRLDQEPLFLTRFALSFALFFEIVGGVRICE